MDAATTEINASASACETTVLQSANTSSSSSPPHLLSLMPPPTYFLPPFDQSPPTVAEDVSDHASELLGLTGREPGLKSSGSVWVFLRFSKYEYALVTGLKFRHTDFDPNEDYSYPSEGVYKRKICRGRGGIKLNDLDERSAEGEFAVSTDDQLKISKINGRISHGARIPSKSFTRRFSKSLIPGPQKLRNSHTISTDSAMPSLVHKECLETLEPTIEELIDYSSWSHVADDVRSHVQYVQRESPFTDYNAGAPAASNVIVPADALMTPIKIPLPATKELTPIRVDSDQLNSLLDPVVRFELPLRPTVAFKGSTFWMNKKQSKEMDTYRCFMASDSDELRNIDNTLHANRLFFRHIENTETAMDKSAMGAYLRILHNSPDFVGLRPEKKEVPFTVQGVFFYDMVSDMFIRNEGRNDDPEHDRDSTDHLTEDMCVPYLILYEVNIILESGGRR
ncbi:hypothetical protein CASFOL_014545 [Castilleja foliolosa]|uniref:Uncharacterized protein n=1 Tax=Castilleja foliolosa TaxID=1961234 RepID=A0ABD3DN96_9LAMI